MPKLPNLIYVRYEGDPEDPYLLAHDTLSANIAESDHIETIGTYKLAETHKFRKLVTAVEV